MFGADTTFAVNSAVARLATRPVHRDGRDMAQTHHTFCRICEALCGLQADVEGDRVVALRPDPNHVATSGYACVKGLNQHRMYDSPDRLKYVLRRTDDGHVPTSWTEALADIGGRLRRLIGTHGPSSVGMYVGTAAGFGVLHPVFAQGFMDALGSRSMYASASQDCSNKFAVAQHMYGFAFTQPFPDLDHTECLIVVGANPAISKWSFGQVPNPAARLKALVSRGGRLYFVDPRRTESAKVAGTHVSIRPGTDVFFYLSFLHEVLKRRAYDRSHVDRFMRGFETIEQLAKGWTPERTALITRVPPDVLRQMVDDYVRAPGAALYCSTGVNMGGHGALSFWLQEVINAISGNLDRRGGTLVGKGVIDFAKFGKKNGLLGRPDRSRIGNFPSVNDAFPGGTLADEILTEGPGQIRALFVTGGNPLLTMPNSDRLAEAFAKLDLLVVLDIQPTETASLAHYVLPCTSPLQRPDLPFIFPLMLGLQTEPYLQATRAIVPPEGDQRDEASIYLDLCRAAGVGLFGSMAAQTALEMARDINRAVGSSAGGGLPQERLLDVLLRLCGQGGFRGLLKHPHGKRRGAHTPGDFLEHRVVTDDRKVDLAPDVLVSRSAVLARSFERELEVARELKLITKRQVKTHNSWTHNLTDFVHGFGRTNRLYMHPLDASARGLRNGDLVDVTSASGAVRVPMTTSDDLSEGTVALPHGWGHQAAKGLSVASKTTGVNANILAADGPENLDPISGMAHLTGILVRVEPARGPLNGDHWTGMPPKNEDSKERKRPHHGARGVVGRSDGDLEQRVGGGQRP